MLLELSSSTRLLHTPQLIDFISTALEGGFTTSDFTFRLVLLPEEAVASFGLADDEFLVFLPVLPETFVLLVVLVKDILVVTVNSSSVNQGYRFRNGTWC
jgi:hypothetical protein